MNKRQTYLGIALVLASFGASAKQATSNDSNKPFPDSGKRERRMTAPESGNASESWQPYLRWHRSARLLQGSNDRLLPFGREPIYRQL
jgi:hypothetical protein